MSTRTLIRLGAYAVVFAATSSCGGDATAPTFPSAAARRDAAERPLASAATSSGATARAIRGPVLAKSMRRGKRFVGSVTVVARIDSRGGVLDIKSAGLTLVVPRGAVTRPTLFRATALQGDMVAYDFEPHGTHFGVPVRVEQSVRGTDWRQGPGAPPYEAGYFKDARQLDGRQGTALVDEFLPVTYEARAGRMSFQVEHFSGYMISTGHVKLPDAPTTP
jgi:ZU5 domain